MWVEPTVKLLGSTRGNQGTYLMSVTPYNSQDFISDIQLVVQITTCTVYWYFLLHYNCYIRPKETPSDSTQSRDQQLNQWTLPETPMPGTEVLITIRPQINFLWHNCINEIHNIVTFTANTTHIIPTFTNLPVIGNTLHISDSP